jgi:hypothetical protein
MAMHFQWLTTEHNRLHVVEEWPDGPAKTAALAAIRSTMAGLLRNAPSGMTLPLCEVCLSRLIELPVQTPRAEKVREILAA